MDFSFIQLSVRTADILDKALTGRQLTIEEGTFLLETTGHDLMALIAVADEVRKRAVGDNVTYVVNRNINFTNICSANCRFCGFHRPVQAEDAFLLTAAEVGQKAEEAWNSGAGEVCVQGGLHPQLPGTYYLDVLREIKQRAPKIHVHAFSPMEIFYGASRMNIPVPDFLRRLKDAGLDSIPGTAAEILSDDIRSKICPRKINTQTWKTVIKAAHKAGLPTTSTMMYGHIEKPYHQALHLAAIREIQQETGGFTEFVPLSFVHPKTRLYQEDGSRAGTDGLTELKIFAVSRLMLNGYVDNIQVSWVKLGKRLAQVCLSAGGNDFGGTLSEEKIAAAAGADTPGAMSECELINAITSIGRYPVRRTTLYEY